MWTTVNIALDVTRVFFGIPRGGHNPDAAAVSAPLWTPQHAPYMRPRPGLRSRPSPAFSVSNRPLNGFLRMVGHRLGLSRIILTTDTITLLQYVAKYNSEKQRPSQRAQTLIDPGEVKCPRSSGRSLLAIATHPAMAGLSIPAAGWTAGTRRNVRRPAPMPQTYCVYMLTSKTRSTLDQ